MAQMKNQYEGYFYFWWFKWNEVVTFYCGSLFLGHCNSDELIEHFAMFGKDTCYFPSLSMDSLNINKCFEKYSHALFILFMTLFGMNHLN